MRYLALALLIALTGCGRDNRAGDGVSTAGPYNEAPGAGAATTPGATSPGTAAPGTSTAGDFRDADEAADRVENALDNDAGLRPFDLDADDENGTIVISGRVATEAQRAEAEALARQTAPGFDIVNRIELR